MINLKLIKPSFRFAQKLFIALSIFFAFAILIIHQYTNQVIEANLYESLGERAQIQAKEIAAIPDLAMAVKNKDLERIKRLIMLIDQQSDASYIVIGNKDGIRLFHSRNVPINVPMVGDDNHEVFQGKSIINIGLGSLGRSLRGKAPIIHNGDVIGIVSVGYMLDKLDELHKNQSSPFVIFCIILFIILFVFSYILSYSIKKKMIDLEPKDISLLVKMQSAIMESINEGLIAIDLNYNITHINQFTKRFLDIPHHVENLNGTNLFLYITNLNDFLNKEDCLIEDIYDQVGHFNDEVVIASRIRLIFNDQIQGWVITFRNMNKVNLLSKRLSQVQQYADNLRALRHEHQNWLATLLGLIHMNRYDDAKEFITRQSTHSQQQLDFINDHFKVPTIAGLLIGKLTKANEMGIELQFDPLCRLQHIPDKLTEMEFMSIIANLIDNAFTASLNKYQQSEIKKKKVVHLYLSDATDEYVIEVTDEGNGVDEKIKASIFKLGITTKEKGDGIGLHLVKTYTEKANGYIEVSNNLPQGTIFSIFIPQKNIEL